jgi:hypothetical protein
MGAAAPEVQERKIEWISVRTDPVEPRMQLLQGPATLSFEGGDIRPVRRATPSTLEIELT